MLGDLVTMSVSPLLIIERVDSGFCCREQISHQYPYTKTEIIKKFKTI